jgi:uncharacterized protein YndB with AHSA1/START domain
MKKSLMYIFSILISCTTGISAHNGEGTVPSETFTIHWPAEYEPSKAKFFVHNRINVNASPEIVWELLIDAEKWPQWYNGASDLALQDTLSDKLGSGSVFTWRTMGLNFESTITEFVPYSRLSWESMKNSIRGYHAWLIIPTESGCTVITEESQFGWLTFFEKLFQPNKLRRLHDVWLEEIKRIAESQMH